MNTSRVTSNSSAHAGQRRLVSRGGRPNEGVRNVQRTTRATGSSSVPLQNLQSSTIYFMSWYASLAPHTIVCAVKATSAGDWAKGPWVAHTTRMCRCAVQAAGTPQGTRHRKGQVHLYGGSQQGCLVPTASARTDDFGRSVRYFMLYDPRTHHSVMASGMYLSITL